MEYTRSHRVRGLLGATVLTALAASATSAQTRVVLPTGSVILVRTEQVLESGSAQVGQTFETTVLEPVSVNGYTIIPADSHIRGVVAYVQPATRQQSGVMQVAFNRITVPGGAVYPITGKLTSTDSTERRQIDARADNRVVLVGERGGIGAAITGAGSNRGSAGGILAALGNLLSEGTNVSVAAGTQLAVQLERPLTLTGSGSANNADPSTIYTATDRIRAAQTALARKSYYRGTATGVLDNATRRAIFEYQLDNNITATGNLDGRTASALGILDGADASAGGAAFSPRDATLVRRAAQALTALQRRDLGITAQGQTTGSRNATAPDLELLFALSAFADNSALLEQLATQSANSGTPTLAEHSLIAAAQRVDSAIAQARTSSQVRAAWNAIREQLAALDPAYGR